MAKNKQLNLSTLKKLDAELNKTVEITLSNSYTLQIDKHFRQSLIEEIFADLISIQNIINQNKDDEQLNNFPLEKFAMFLLILNFTSLKSIKTKSLEDKLSIMRMLVDQGLFKEIIERIEQEVPEELQKFNTSIISIMEEKMEQLKVQEQFISVFNEEMEKEKIKNIGKEINDESVEVTVTVDENEEGDENLESESTVEDNRTEVTN